MKGDGISYEQIQKATRFHFVCLHSGIIIMNGAQCAQFYLIYMINGVLSSWIFFPKQFNILSYFDDYSALPPHLYPKDPSSRYYTKPRLEATDHWAYYLFFLRGIRNLVSFNDYKFHFSTWKLCPTFQTSIPIFVS